jgi:hypothetical protein
VLSDDARAERYPLLAVSATSPGTGGSSVEGEQPKFLATLADIGPAPTPVIVKFTDQLSTATGRRWADLLVAEAHALAILHAHGEAHAVPRLLDAGGRRFLEVPRYDRVGPFGRRGVISLRALHDAFPSPSATQWPAAAASLAALDLLAPETVRAIRRRHAFGRLIGNSDMHFGNLAFWCDDALPFRLAPAYDMLPMQWAPTPGEAAPDPAFEPALPLPADREIWHEAAAWADAFWARVANDPLVSPAFGAIAARARQTLARLCAVA